MQTNNLCNHANQQSGPTISHPRDTSERRAFCTLMPAYPWCFCRKHPPRSHPPSLLDLFVSQAGLRPDAAPVRLGMRRRLLGEKPRQHSPPPCGEAPPARSAAWGRSPAIPLRHLGSRPAGPRRRMGESALRNSCTGYAPPALRDSF